MTHAGGMIHYINLLSMGFTADVAALTNRQFKSLGELGYLLGVLICLARLRRRAFPLRVDEEKEWDRRRCLFLTFNNSKFTGGKMMIAPQADSGDGLVEFVRWGPIGAAGTAWRICTGSTTVRTSRIRWRRGAGRGGSSLTSEVRWT